MSSGVAGERERVHVLSLGEMAEVERQLEPDFEVHRAGDEELARLVAERGAAIRAIATRGRDRIDASLIARLSALEIIANFGVGYDSIDLGAAAARRIVVTNTPDVLDDEVADFAVALLLATVRRLPQADRFVRAGRWLQGNFPLGPTLRDRTVGFAGMGRIGKRIARRLSSFDVPIVYHARTAQPGLPYRHYPDLLGMAKEVDTLVAVVPGGAGTRHLINAAVLAALGPRGILINVARGSVVDEVALIEALRSGTILAAGLDVYADEPRVPQALIDLDNVVLVPHIGSATHHTRGRMGRLVVENLRSWFDGRGPVTPVPETPWPAAANRGSVDGPPRGAPVVDTDRLVLRKFTPHDAGFILRLLNEPSFLQSIGDRGVRTIEQAIHYLADGPIQSYARHGHGLYLVVLKETLQPIGMCGLLKRDRFPDADLGYAFLPEFWSRGYACESAAAVLRFARSSLALSRIVAFVSPGNAASVRVLEKLGFSFAGGTKLEPDASEVALYELCSIEEC